MRKITSVIDESEVEWIAKSNLNSEELREVFLIIENDPIFWDDIRKATSFAVGLVMSGNWK